MDQVGNLALDRKTAVICPSSSTFQVWMEGQIARGEARALGQPAKLTQWHGHSEQISHAEAAPTTPTEPLQLLDYCAREEGEILKAQDRMSQTK